MILGLRLTWSMITMGGAFVFALLVFQMLVGLRVIRFKGRTHAKVHRWGAWVLAGAAAFHGVLALAVLNHWRILS